MTEILAILTDSFREILHAMVLAALTSLLAALTAVIGLSGKRIRQWLESKAHAAAFNCATEKLEQFSINAVSEIEQTLVRQLKQENRWTVDTARRARDSAVEIVERQLGTNGVAELKSCLGIGYAQLQGLIVTYIEKHVLNMGRTDPTAPVVPFEAKPQA